MNERPESLVVMVTCPNCGRISLLGSGACPGCGNRFTPANGPPRPDVPNDPGTWTVADVREWRAWAEDRRTLGKKNREHYLYRQLLKQIARGDGDPAALAKAAIGEEPEP